MTGQQVAKLRDTAVETYMSTTELSEEKTISETLVTGGEEMFSSQELHRSVPDTGPASCSGAAGRAGTDDIGEKSPRLPTTGG